MGQIDLNDLQKRKLQKCYLAWYIIDKEITIKDDNCIQKKKLYTIYGVDIVGNVSGKRKDVLKPQARSDIIRIKLEVITFLPIDYS